MTQDSPPDQTQHDADHDGIDRRNFLSCMAWAGTGVLWLMRGGGSSPSVSAGSVAQHGMSGPISASSRSATATSASTRPPTQDVIGTLQAAIARINALPQRARVRAAHRRHHPSREARGVRHRATRSLKGAKAGDVFYVPGEHDVFDDNGTAVSSSATARARKGRGWHSFDYNGVHFIGLVNVMNLKAGGLGNLGDEQLEWLEHDVKHLVEQHADRRLRPRPAVDRLSASGAGARTTARRRSRYLKRFGSVTVLNGHIHQIMQKVEGNITFHTARPPPSRSPGPGTAPSQAR